MSKQITTYSSWRKFMDCQRAYYWRYVQELVLSGEHVPALFFGTLMHDALRLLYLGDLHEATVVSEKDPILQVMFSAYQKTYPLEDFEVISVEEQFEGPIVNPSTGKPSKTFVLAGKMDAEVLLPEEGLHVLEHKSTSVLDKDYLDLLWTDFQSLLYSLYLGRKRETRVKGIIYNILQKPRANTKDIDGWYAKENRFHREYLVFSDNDYRRVESQLWALTQQLLYAQRTGTWIQNTRQCFVYHRKCPYYQICKSDDNPLVIENYYEHKPAHSELNTDDNELL